MSDFEQIRDYWDRHAERDPLWAVLSDESKSGGRWDVGRFFQTGINEIAAVFYQLDSRRLEVRVRSALDFGCGVGRLTQALATYFDRVVGVDISPRMVALANEFNVYPSRVSYVANPYEDLRLFDDASFDFIVTNIVLQHLPGEMALTYVGEFLRLLTPGGLLVFQLPSHRRPADESSLVSSARAMADEAYQASIAVVGVDTLDLNPGGDITLLLAITNTSSQDWIAEHSGVMGAGNHWLSAGGDRMLNRDDGRTVLPPLVAAGETCHLPLKITAPPDEGDYQCAIDIAHEGVVWFHDKGSPLVTVPVRVGRSRRTADERAVSLNHVPTRAPERTVDRSAAALLHSVKPDRPDPGAFPMHGVDRRSVIDVIGRRGGTLLHIEDDICAGADWMSFRYYVRRN